MELIPFNSDNNTTSIIKEEKHEVIVKAIEAGVTTLQSIEIKE